MILYNVFGSVDGAMETTREHNFFAVPKADRNSVSLTVKCSFGVPQSGR
jgi:hypothetical protein